MTGNPGLDKALIGLNTVIVLIGTALVVYAHLGIKKPQVDESATYSAMVTGSIVEQTKSPVTFKEVVVNLYSREARLRFVSLILNIETFREDQRSTVEIKKPIILDSLIDIASNMKPDEVNSITGKILLATRVKKSVNSKLHEPLIKKIYFSKFIVQ